MSTTGSPDLPAGASVFVHQAFRCCPYAGMVTSQIHDYLAANGHSVVTDATAASVHLVHTCGSDARQAELTWHALETIAARAPDAAVVVTGCLVSIEPKTLREKLAPFATHASFDPRHLDGLDAVFRAPAGPATPAGPAFAEVLPALHNEYVGNDFSEGWHHILASTGCLGACTFCAIRRATGRPRSRAIPEILADIDRALVAGHHDLLLVSTDLSVWGTDRGESVVDLVRAVVAHPGDFLVSAESWEPTWFLRHFEALLPLFASGRFAFLGVPIQSGSARVIAQMGRTYDPADVVAAVRRLRAAAPGLVVRTDLLYGYGDETDADFAASLDASRAFDLPSFNAYQPRPGTPPLELPAAVLQARRDEGFAELHRRAQAGVARVRRWGQADAPAEPPPAAAPPAPWDEPAGRAWLTRTAARFAAVSARRGGVPLGDTRWALVGARAGRDAVELLLHGPSGATQVVGVRDPAWPGPYFGATARFGLQVRTSSLPAGSDTQDRVLAALLGALGG